MSTRIPGKPCPDCGRGVGYAAEPDEGACQCDADEREKKYGTRCQRCAELQADNARLVADLAAARKALEEVDELTARYYFRNVAGYPYQAKGWNYSRYGVNGTTHITGDFSDLIAALRKDAAVRGKA